MLKTTLHFQFFFRETVFFGLKKKLFLMSPKKFLVIFSQKHLILFRMATVYYPKIRWDIPTCSFVNVRRVFLKGFISSFHFFHCVLKNEGTQHTHTHCLSLSVSLSLSLSLSLLYIYIYTHTRDSADSPLSSVPNQQKLTIVNRIVHRVISKISNALINLYMLMF